MNQRIVPISQLNNAQISALAHLHGRALHSLLTDLGFPIVERYYRLASQDSSVIGFCLLTESGNLIGWVSGSPQPKRVNGRLREALGWFLLQMLRVLVTRPRAFAQLLASLKSSSASMAEGSIELTYLGVDMSARKQGVGQALLQKFTQAAQAAGYRSVVLSVEVENESAIALYTKAGFKTIQAFTEGRFQRLRMELTF